MGINLALATLLASARRRDRVDFGRTITIGRMSLNLTAEHARQLLARVGAPPIDDLDRDMYADRFLMALLGIRDLQAIDYSDYEGAQIVHDLNEPAPERLHGAFDALIDGGSLEHVFNVPTALASYMNLVRQGGSLFLSTPANNHMGHGFYQFSPELFYRVLSPDYGFEVREMILAEHRYPSAELGGRLSLYSVADPARVGTRVGLVSRRPAAILVHAVRTSADLCGPLRPIQSDYAAMHGGEAAARVDRGSALSRAARAVYNGLPLGWRHAAAGAAERYRYSFRNTRTYRKWSPFE